MDIIALVETNFDDEIKDYELGLNNYNIYRCDRNVFNSLKKTGGGVILAIKNKYYSEEIIFKSSSFEQVNVKLIVGDKNIFIGLVYFPPNMPFKKYRNYINETQDQVFYLNLMNSFDD